ncbi:MAG: hypothetical protein IZT57_05330, partial [Chloroflexi bacterium]|nr:hypothetical protein [Chloroflexota bacterium]
MSNVFQALVRDTGGVIPLNIGVGVIADPFPFQGLNLDATGAIYAIDGGTAVHHSHGLPIDADGRLVVLTGAVDYVSQVTPFTVDGLVAIGGETISHYSQGVGYTDTGAYATTGGTPPPELFLWTPNYNGT